MYICTNCSHTLLKWTGKCPSCGSWNTLVEKEGAKKVGRLTKEGAKKTISSLDMNDGGILGEARYHIASSEFASVLGGGIVPGSFILLSGEPGIGKSTLTLQLADWFSQGEQTALYVSAEENLSQISARAKRMGIQNSTIRLLTESVFEDILETILTDSSSLVILDSISVFQSTSLETNAGSTGLVRSMAEVLMQTAKKTGKTIVIIGHVTKDGAISGPKALEHLVDTVLFLEGSKYENYRILRALKNRFGPTDEIGLFQMTEKWLIDIANPGTEFISNTRNTSIGSALSMTVEWNRPLLVEIEALTTYTKFGYPKRSSRGINTGKLDLVIAVLSKYSETKLENYDIFANVGRWLQINEPAIDLALAAAILSSKIGVPLGNKIFIGELSLTGSIRAIVSIEKRVEEARKLGFTEIYIPASTKISPKLEKSVVQIGHVRELEKHIKRPLSE